MHTLSDTTSFPLPLLQTCFKKEIMTFFLIKKEKTKNRKKEKKANNDNNKEH